MISRSAAGSAPAISCVERLPALHQNRVQFQSSFFSLNTVWRGGLCLFCALLTHSSGLYLFHTLKSKQASTQQYQRHPCIQSARLSTSIHLFPHKQDHEAETTTPRNHGTTSTRCASYLGFLGTLPLLSPGRLTAAGFAGPAPLPAGRAAGPAPAFGAGRAALADEEGFAAAEADGLTAGLVVGLATGLALPLDTSRSSSSRSLRARAESSAHVSFM
jgi:hypothetical protein